LSRENKIVKEGKQTCGRVKINCGKGKIKLWKRENEIL